MTQKPPTYIVGIDLGTTNSVLAATSPEIEADAIEVLPVPQLTAPATVESHTELPSFLYIGTEEECAHNAFRLPWGVPADAIGVWARRQSADAPARTVVGAKSWLAHSLVDRHAPILPWNAPEDVSKRSPVEVSRRIIEHLAAAWNHAHPDAPIAEQRVVLTVPASFDAAARELTREAAHLAGLPEDTILIEEPQAAFYAWLTDRARDWREQVGEGDTILVCDVGGGTTDLTLIGVESENGELMLRRLAVGNHILVGGDNMDLSLAHLAREALGDQGGDLDAWQSVALWHACRTAKEKLLGPDAPEQYPIAVLGRGRRMIGGSLSVTLTREQVRSSLLEGFMPRVALEDRPARGALAGFRELGLPFESDPAITRHLAHFLSRNGAARPTHVLFNGGVFRSPLLRERLLSVLGDWFGDDARPRELTSNTAPEAAVARGAAGYGRAKTGRGIRIRGGVPRAYYVGIETAGPAVPGAKRPLRQLCVVPRGMEEGTHIEVPSPPIGLLTGEAAVFRFFASSVRDDAPGDLLSGWREDELSESDSLTATLPPAASGEAVVPVHFETHLSELGELELWCVGEQDNTRWKLSFSVRTPSSAAAL